MQTRSSANLGASRPSDEPTSQAETPQQSQSSQAKQKWTVTEDIKLKNLRECELTYRQIARCFQSRTEGSVAARLRSLKKAEQKAEEPVQSSEPEGPDDVSHLAPWERPLQPGAPWDDEEDELLQALERQGMSREDIAVRISRHTMRSIESRSRYLMMAARRQARCSPTTGLDVANCINVGGKILGTDADEVAARAKGENLVDDEEASEGDGEDSLVGRIKKRKRKSKGRG